MTCRSATRYTAAGSQRICLSRECEPRKAFQLRHDIAIVALSDPNTRAWNRLLLVRRAQNPRDDPDASREGAPAIGRFSSAAKSPQDGFRPGPRSPPTPVEFVKLNFEIQAADGGHLLIWEGSQGALRRCVACLGRRGNRPSEDVVRDRAAGVVELMKEGLGDDPVMDVLRARVTQLRSEKKRRRWEVE